MPTQQYQSFAVLPFRNCPKPSYAYQLLSIENLDSLDLGLRPDDQARLRQELADLWQQCTPADDPMDSDHSNEVRPHERLAQLSFSLYAHLQHRESVEGLKERISGLEGLVRQKDEFIRRQDAVMAMYSDRDNEVRTASLATHPLLAPDALTCLYWIPIDTKPLVVERATQLHAARGGVQNEEAAAALRDLTRVVMNGHEAYEELRRLLLSNQLRRLLLRNQL